MADVTNLSATVTGNDVTLTWSNPSFPIAPCTVLGYDYPERTWEIYRNTTLLHVEVRSASHPSPNGFTSWTDPSVPDGNYTYKVRVLDNTTRISLTNFDACELAPTDIGNYVSINVGVNSVDTTPDPFDLGADIADAGRGTEHISKTVQVAGINAAAPISITGTGASYAINNGTWTTAAGTVNQGDFVRVKIVAASTFSTTRTATLDIGGVTDTWSVTTRADATGPLISLPRITPPISLQGDIRAFFGPRQGFALTPPPVTLTNYLRGGPYVPDISANSGVPTAGPIRLTDLLAAAIDWGFDTEPSSLWDTAFRTQSTVITLRWLEGDNYSLKKGAAGQAEYWWDVVVTDPHPNIVITTGPAALQTWTPDGFDFGITGQWTGPIPAGGGLSIGEDSGSASGTATLKVRSVYDPANTVIQATVNWSILFI